MISSVDRFLHRVCKVAWSRPQLTVITTALIAIAFASQLPKLQTHISIHDLVGPEFPSLVSYQKVDENFSIGNAAVYLFKSTDGQPIPDSVLCEIEGALLFEQVYNSEILGILAPFELGQAYIENDFLKYKTVLDLQCSPSVPGQSSLHKLGQSPWRNILLADDNQSFLVEVNFRNTVGGSRFGRFDPMPAQKFFLSFKEFLSRKNIPVSIESSGEASFQWQFLKGMERDQFINIIAMLLIIVVCRSIFGSWKSGLLMCLSLIVTGSVVFGLMALAGVAVDILTNTLFLMITVAAIQDFVFLSSYQKQHGSGWRETFEAYITPSFFTSLTTVIGFGSLAFADLGPIREFGFWAAFGAAVEWGVTFLFLPSFMQCFPSCGKWTSSRHWFTLEAFNDWMNKARDRRIAKGLLIAGTLCIFSIPFLNVTDSSLKTLDSENTFLATIDYLKAKYGWEGVIYLEGDAKMDASRILEIRRGLTANENIVAIEDPYEILDFSRGDTSSKRRDVIDFEIQNTAEFERYFSEDGHSLYRLYVKNSDNAAISNLGRFVDDLCRDDCQLLGSIVSYEEFSQFVIPSLFKSFLGSLLLVSIVLGVLCLRRNRKLILPVMLASYWGIWTSIALVAGVGYRVNFITCIFASVLVGIAGDNAIQFLLGQNKSTLEGNIYSKSLGSVNVVFIMAVISSLFAFSSFEPPQMFGPLFCFSLVFTLIGDVWILLGILPEGENEEALSGAK